MLRTLARIEVALLEIARRLTAIERLLSTEGPTIMSELDDLKASVAATTQVEASAIALLQGLKAKLDAAIAAGDPAALTSLSSALGSETSALSAAIVANTPADPTVNPPAPAPVPAPAPAPTPDPSTPPATT